MSDKEKSIGELTLRVKKFCDDRDWNQFHDAKELAVGLIIEAGELLEHFRWKTRDEVNNYLSGEKRNGVEEELADIFYYVLRIAQLYNVDLSEAFDKKMTKNEEKYDVNKFKGSNKKYNEA
jgi:NTP pyrophosphatase (non-canonical NTP hydrolase)